MPNVVVALRVAERLGPDATVVTILCDSGLRYLSTELYNEDLPCSEPNRQTPDGNSGNS